MARFLAANNLPETAGARREVQPRVEVLTHVQKDDAVKKIALVTIFSLPGIFAAAPALSAPWSHGKVDLVESFSNYIVIRWSGPSTENCGSNAVRFDQSTLGSVEAVERGYSAVLAATLGGKPIRFHLDGCISEKQKATVVQLCAKDTCSY